jgi:alpha-2-macroglobulin
MNRLWCLIPLLLTSYAAADGTEVNLYVGRNVAPAEKIRLNINSRNVPKVALDIFRVDPMEVIRNRWTSKLPARPAGRPVRSMTVDISGGRKPFPAPQDTYYQRTVNLMNLPPAVYLVVARGGKEGTNSALLNVTNLSVILKSSRHRSLAWVTDFKSGIVVTGAKVNWLDDKQKALGSGTTDKDGIALLNRPIPTNVSHTLWVQRGNDNAFIEGGASSREGQIVSHFWTDRPLYRPGQNVTYRLVLRRVKGIEYEPVKDTDLTVSIYDPVGTFLERRKIKSSASGLMTGEFLLPSEAVLGNYSVQVTGPGVTAYQAFEVQEFRKPEFKVEIKPGAKQAFSGDKVSFEVASEYFFGAKVPGADVEYTVTLSGASRYDPMYGDDGNRYASNVYGGSTILARGRVKADKAGLASIEANIPKDAPTGSVSLNVTVTDGTRRQIQATSSMPTFASAVLVSVSTKNGYVPLGRLAPIEVRLRNTEGKPIAGTAEVKLQITVYNSVKREQEIKVLATNKVKVPESGVITVEMPAKTGPNLEIVATAADSKGRVSRDTAWLWVADPNERIPVDPPTPEINIQSETRDVELGKPIRTFIRTNQGTKRPLLVTLEGYDLFAYSVQRGSGPQVWQTIKEHSPNVWVRGAQWVKGSLIQGSAEIPVRDPSRALSVKLEPVEAQLAPGDRSRWRIAVRDFQQKPVAAELGVSIVDAALLAIQADQTADLSRTFWGRRELMISTTSSAPQEYEGGAFQDKAASPMAEMGGQAPPPGAPVRKRFEDTAYWNPSVVTDEQGNAEFDFELPGNLTTWRATARGLSATSAAGTATSSQMATRPLTLRLATPRQMVLGDKLNLIATVTNRTDRAETVSVKLNGRETKTEVPAKGDARLEFPIPTDTLGTQTFLGELMNAQGVREDALQVSVPVVPDAVEFRTVESQVYKGEKSLSIALPKDHVPGAGKAVLTFFAGRSGVISTLDDRIEHEWRYGPAVAVAQIDVARAKKLDYSNRKLIEPLASLGRSDTGNGWGLWPGAMVDPVMTARVLEAIGGWNPTDGDRFVLPERAFNAATNLFQNSGFAEHRAFLVAALSISKPNPDQIRSVLEREEELSPNARLALVQALIRAKMMPEAQAQYKLLRDTISRGTGKSFLPVGDGIGWVGSETEANARMIRVGLQLGDDASLLNEIGEWLSDAATNWCSITDGAAATLAMRELEAKYPSAKSLSSVAVKVGGADVPVRTMGDNLMAVAEWPLSQGSTADVAVQSPGGAPRYRFDVRSYRRVANEEGGIIRTLFRWEVQNAAGAWQELNRNLRPNEPVRCTAVVWGDAITDAVRVKLPIPAGFEFTQFGKVGEGRAEVRDGAVLYFTELRDGLPGTFRFYLRGETDGEITILPAEAEVIRRPEVRGYSNARKVKLVGAG